MAHRPPPLVVRIAPHQRLARFACAILLIAGAVAVWQFRNPYRSVEAVVSAWSADHLLKAPVFAYSPEAVVFVGRPVRLGFTVTPECSSFIITIIFLLGSAVLAVLAPRFRLRRILMALGLAGVLAITVNLIRVLFIVLASSEWGRDVGFPLSHEYVGSTVTVLGMALALFVYLALLVRDRSPGDAP